MANSITHRFLTDSNKLVLNLRGYALFRNIFRLQLATQDTGHVGTFNELLNGLDQPPWLNVRPQAEHRASCFRQSKSRELVCSLNVGQALRLRGGSLRRIQLHGNTDKTLRQRIMNLTGHSITFSQDGGLSRSLP